MPTSLPQGDTSLNKPLKVWHVVGPMNHGGAEVMVMELLRHKAPGTEVSFLVHQRREHFNGSADFDAEIAEHGARLLPIVTPTQSGLSTYLRAFRKVVVEQGRPDVIHTHLNARSGLVALAAWRNGIPRIIVHAHAALTIRGSFSYRMIAHAELAVAKLIFGFVATDFWGCSREAVASQFPRFCSRYQSRVIIQNAINIENFEAVTHEDCKATRASLLGEREGLLLGTVGRIVRHKNAALMVEILDILRRRGVEATAVIVGREADSAYCSEIRARAAEIGLSKALRFVGPRNDIPSVMAALDVFVSPALREGFGMVGLEAQAAGTPSVLSTGFPSIIDMGLGIVQVPDGFDPEAWAEAVLDAANTKRVCPKQASQRIAERGFSAIENTRRVEKAWRDPSFIPGDPA